MIFEIWEFSDEAGCTWHLQAVDSPDARYDAFLRSLEYEDMFAECIKTFDSENEDTAKEFYLNFLGFRKPKSTE